MPFQKGRERTGGRKKGVPNRINTLMGAAARTAAPLAIKKLVELMQSAKDEKIQLKAAVEILNRAYGKPVIGSEQEVAPLEDEKSREERRKACLAHIQEIADRYSTHKTLQ